MDPFQEISAEDWPWLSYHLQTELSKSFILFNWLNTRFQWMKKSSGSKDYSFHILAPGGDVKHGLVTYGKTKTKCYYLTVYIFNENTNKIKNALLKTSLIDWEEKYVCGVPTGHEEWFKDILRQKGYKIHHDTPTDYYKIPKEVPQSYEISCPNDVYIDYLKAEDVPKINNMWQHKFEGSDSLISECIKMNYGFGLYLKGNDELISWILKYEYGDLSILQTVEEYRRLGYAKLVVQSICKRVSEDGEDILLFIVPGNSSSEKLFKSMGAQYVDSYNWVEYE